MACKWWRSGWSPQQRMQGAVSLSLPDTSVHNLINQYISHPALSALLAAGVVQRWQGPVGVLKPGGRFEPLGGEVPLYVASKGMRQLAQHMADEVRS